MNQIRTLGVSVDVKASGIKDMEDTLNKEIERLENSKRHVLNVLQCGDKGFLILYEELFTVVM